MEYFQMIMALVGVLALVFALFWLMKKLNKRVAVGGGRHIKVLERINLAPDKMLLLISVREKCMVICVTSNGAEKICDLDETLFDLYPELNTAGEESGYGNNGGFKAVLENMLKKNEKK